MSNTKQVNLELAKRTGASWGINWKEYNKEGEKAIKILLFHRKGDT